VIAALGRAGILHPETRGAHRVVQHEFAYIDRLDFGARIGRVRAWFRQLRLHHLRRFGRYEYHNSDQCIARAIEVHAHIARSRARVHRAPRLLRSQPT